MPDSPAPAPRSPWRLRLAGAGLAALGLLGFATVADELHHWEEWLAVAAVFLAGLIVFAASVGSPSGRSPVRGMALGLATGLALGGLAGLVSNQVTIALPVGIALGLGFGIARVTRARA